jgi:predicted double-glycine peptidase
MFSLLKKMVCLFLGGTVFWRACFKRGDEFHKISFPLFLVLALGLLFLGVPQVAKGAEVQVRLLGGGIMMKKVESVKERRQRQVVPQTLDFSCGAAALASLLHYHYGIPMNEKQAILGMFNYGDREGIKQRGFSLLDMKKLCLNLNYQGTGYKVLDVNKLRELNIPVVTLIDTRTYKHFVVIRKVDDNFVYIADPSFGNRKMRLEDFDKVWNKVIFVVTGKINGSPQGLYAGDDLRAPKNEALRVGSQWNRLALDPTMVMGFYTRIPLVGVPFQ